MDKGRKIGHTQVSNSAVTQANDAVINISQFAEFAKSKLGIEIHQNQEDDLIRVVKTACDKFGCQPISYLSKLINAKSDSPELEFFVAGITIGETYFFRDQQQMSMLSNKILPELISRKKEFNSKIIRIWSAGCSSGEEIYTVAMMLREQIKVIEDWNISLLGTDIHIGQLKKAICGVYGEWSMRSITDAYKKKYFKYVDNRYHLVEDIKKMVAFSYLNLKEGMYPSILNKTNSMDLILCRNVLIYFDEKSVDMTVEKLFRCLTESGYLMLGASDPLSVARQFAKNNVYASTLFQIGQQNKAVVVSQNPSTNGSGESKDSSKREDHNEKQSSMLSTSDLRQLVQDEKWAEVIEVTSERVTTKISDLSDIYIRAFALANAGRLDDAIAEFNHYFARSGTDKMAYLYYALTLIELNRLDEAEKSIRKALYLDYKCIMCMIQMGLIQIRKNQKNEGMKWFMNALDVARSRNKDEKSITGMTYGQLIAVLEKEIALYAGKME